MSNLELDEEGQGIVDVDVGEDLDHHDHDHHHHQIGMDLLQGDIRNEVEALLKGTGGEGGGGGPMRRRRSLQEVQRKGRRGSKSKIGSGKRRTSKDMTSPVTTTNTTTVSGEGRVEEGENEAGEEKEEGEQEEEEEEEEGQGQGQGQGKRKITQSEVALETIVASSSEAAEQIRPFDLKKPKRGRRSKAFVQDPELEKPEPKILKKGNRAGLFICQVAGCEQFFSRKEHLERHLMMHTGEKPFRCMLCPKGFSREDNLKQHLRVHEKKTKSAMEKLLTDREGSTERERGGGEGGGLEQTTQIYHHVE
jgi:hypothetical protein